MSRVSCVSVGYTRWSRVSNAFVRPRTARAARTPSRLLQAPARSAAMDLEASDDLGKSSSSIKAGVREMEVGVASETGRPASPPLSFPSEAHFSSEARASSTLGAGRAPNNSTDDIPWSDVDPTQRVRNERASTSPTSPSPHTDPLYRSPRDVDV